MIKLNNIIKETSKRNVPIPDEKKDQVLNKHFNISLSSEIKYYRGRSAYKENDFFINPQKITRTSKDTSNVYYVLFDELDSWKDYPSRSKSIIFTNNNDVATKYSGPYKETYNVYPNNNAHIAWGRMSGYIELPYMHKNGFGWSAMAVSEYVLFLMVISLMDIDNDEISSDLQYYKRKLSTHESAKDILLELRGKYLSAELMDKYIAIMREENRNPTDVQIKYLIKNEDNSIYNIIDDLLNPENNEIFHGNINELNNFMGSHTGEDYEIWTDGLCYLKKYSSMSPANNDQI